MPNTDMRLHHEPETTAEALADRAKRLAGMGGLGYEAHDFLYDIIVHLSALASPTVEREADETQEAIGKWADEVFGPVMDLPRAVERASEEMVELHEEADGGADPDKMIVEAADVVIILMRFAQSIGRDLKAAVNAKMAVNRARKWNSDGTGHGYHVSPSNPTPPKVTP